MDGFAILEGDHPQYTRFSVPEVYHRAPMTESPVLLNVAAQRRR